MSDHDNTHDRIGQIIADTLAEKYADSDAPFDIFDSREIDDIADKVMAVLAVELDDPDTVALEMARKLIERPWLGGAPQMQAGIQVALVQAMALGYNSAPRPVLLHGFAATLHDAFSDINGNLASQHANLVDFASKTEGEIDALHARLSQFVKATMTLRNALVELDQRATEVKGALDANIPDGEPVHPQSARLTWPLSTAGLALDATADLPKQRMRPIELNIIRKWPEGFEARLAHVLKDVDGMIPNVKLFDLQRVLAEFGFTMTISEKSR